MQHGWRALAHGHQKPDEQQIQDQTLSRIGRLFDFEGKLKKVSFHSVTIYVFKCGLFSTGEWRVRTRYRTMPNVLLRRVVLLRDAPTKPKFLKLFGQPCPEAEIVKCLKGL